MNDRKKLKLCQLRLVKSVEAEDTCIDRSQDKQGAGKPCKSEFVGQMTRFADDLDQMIEAILKS